LDKHGKLGSRPNQGKVATIHQVGRPVSNGPTPVVGTKMAHRLILSHPIRSRLISYCTVLPYSAAGIFYREQGPN
jgi:hypothetical protein